MFEAVQQRLAQNGGAERRRKAGLKPKPPAAPLAGLVFDVRGNRMTPIAARKGRTRVYRYYVSTAVQLGRKEGAGSLARVPGPALEDLVQDRLGRLGLDGDAIRRIEVGRRQVTVRLTDALGDVEDTRRRLPPTDVLDQSGDEVVLTISAGMRWRGGAKVAIGPEGAPAIEAKRIDLPLLRALVKAEAWRAQLEATGATMNALADGEGVNRVYAQRVVRLAWLGPDLKRSILEGTTPTGMTLKRLLQEDIPLVWADQRRWRSQ
jgi:hypothetical protein